MRLNVCSSFLGGVLLVTACTPMVPVRVLKPPQADIKNIGRVAVLDFIVSRDFNIDNSKDVRQRIVNKLKKDTSFEYLDPENIDRILEREKIKTEDYQNTSNSGIVGRLLRADTLIYGTLLAYDTMDDVEHIKGKRDPSSGERLFQNRIKFIRRVDVAVKFEIIPLNGEKPIIKTLSAESVSEEEGVRDGFAKAALESDKILFVRALDRLTNSLIQLISPHYVEEYWPLKDGKHPELKRGNLNAQDGQWDLARNSWKNVLADNADASIQDKDAALFNLGLLAENEGNFPKAEKIFQKLQHKNKDSLTADILERIREKSRKPE